VESPSIPCESACGLNSCCWPAKGTLCQGSNSISADLELDLESKPAGLLEMSELPPLVSVCSSMYRGRFVILDTFTAERYPPMYVLAYVCAAGMRQRMPCQLCLRSKALLLLLCWV